VTTTQNSAHCDLPRTLEVKHPARVLLNLGRPSFTAVARRRWNLEVLGAENVPASGPVVLAANHIGFLDGPLMAIVGPRPAHALTKDELYTGPLGAFLTASGQICTHRDEVDPAAIKTAVRVLRDGGVVGVFPERTRGGGEMEFAQGGAAYLAMLTGAPVVPMAFLGTRLPGSAASFPPAGTRMVMSHGSPISVEQQGWPRRSADVRAVTERIRMAIIATVNDAERATGMKLPGPLPETDGTSPDVGPASESSKAEND
jgi:1-acyl-sn-glycerol-3-phosphate acyltransferase